MSISLVSNDQLWGLIACHNYSPLHLSSSKLRFCEMLGGTISALLQNLENTNLLERSISAERAAFQIELAARQNPDLREIVADNAAGLMELVDASGIVLHLDGETVEFGTAPQPSIDYSVIRDEVVDGIALVDRLETLAPLSPDQIEVAAGAAYIELSEDGEDYMVLLREQFEHTIRWAGKPEKVERIGADGVVRLSPRGSFAVWRQERQGCSRPFTVNEREILRILRRALFALNSLNRERAAVQAQKEAEAEKARLQIVLLEAARRSSLGELAGALAHELNQPLAAVTNYINACRQELRNYQIEMPEKVAGLMGSAVEESSRAADLVRRLRSFISTGELAREEVDPRKVVQQAAELALASDGSAADISLELDFDNSVGTVLMDPVQVGQVILNLVKNSVEALRTSETKRIVITGRGDEAGITVSVRDTGVGIGEDMLRTIFEPFHGSTTQGLGLGLSLCRSIIEAHGGHIWIHRLATGAEVAFTIPGPRQDSDA
jgi:light-regulated signal transduction histidine kinase (bacteriophytochrome)